MMPWCLVDESTPVDIRLLLVTQSGHVAIGEIQPGGKTKWESAQRLGHAVAWTEIPEPPKIKTTITIELEA